ncbi:MAG: hypothetical protein HY077_06985 [Elusimicrobia bacterium]|nr:hypothetical protein [Elusimicrobiota bacterium]
MRVSFLLSALLAAGCAASAAAYEPDNSQDAFFGGLRDIRQGLLPQAQSLALRKKEEPRLAVPELKAGLPSLGADAPVQYEIFRKGEVYFIYGPGIATQGDVIKGPHLQFGINEKISKDFSVGLVHLNEGHADADAHHNHRDGFAVLGWYDKPLSDKTEVQLGAGPYFSMNTVTIAGEERDDKHWGLLAAVALVHKLNNSGLGLRAQLNHVKMPGTFDTNTVMLGVSQDLGVAQSGSSPGDGASGTTVSLFAGSAVTNRRGQQPHAGYQLEVERAIDKALHYSISVISEGDSGLTNRTGLAAQAWFVAPPAGSWTFSAGAGPYAAYEAEAAQKGAKLLGLISFRAERAMGHGFKLAARFSRVVSSYDKDEDLFMIGIEQELK